MSAFLDSNVLVYAFTTDTRWERAMALLDGSAHIALQGLNEFANVARRKLGMQFEEVVNASVAIRGLVASIVLPDLAIHDYGLWISERYGLQVHDSFMLAAALRADATTFWSEDMHNGLLIDSRLTIRNPFA
jgi:predicted nucleic acid-binding protein